MKKIAKNSLSDRSIYFAEVTTFGDLLGTFSIAEGYFTLFLVSDATKVPVSVISEVAESALDAGCVYLCAWGPDCERVHDIFDEVIVEKDPNETSDSVVMTTWHDKDCLDEAIWFFLNCVFPADDYFDQTKTEMIVAVGNHAWAIQIQDRLAYQASFNSRMLEEKETCHGT